METKGTSDMLKGKVLANMFLEPSTRTRSSFHSGIKKEEREKRRRRRGEEERRDVLMISVAMVRLGGSVIPIDDLTSDSKKGETLQDAIKSIENFVGILLKEES